MDFEELDGQNHMPCACGHDITGHFNGQRQVMDEALHCLDPDCECDIYI